MAVIRERGIVMSTRTWITMTLLTLFLFVPPARSSGMNPGSCLLFPYYDASGATISIHTITNVGTVDVQIIQVFVDGSSGEKATNWTTIRAGDTLTIAAHGVYSVGTGFMYAYVVESIFSHLEKKADVLVGQEIVLGVWDHQLVNFSMNAVSFQALDLVKDERLHLDGKEYTCAPKTLYFPRFFGQDSAFFSRVILINLTGGQYFNVSAECLIYNDNGQVFGDYISFDCFEIMKLTDISAGTTKTFLLNTNHAPQEPWPFYAYAETGAFRIRGVMATNQDQTVKIPNPSIFAVLVEGFGTLGYSAGDLPMQIEDPAVYNHAMLWSTDPSGT